MVLVRQINEALAAAMLEQNLDARRCFACVTTPPPQGDRVRVECSDEAVMKSSRARVGKNGDAAAIDWILLPERGRDLPERLVATSSVADVRRTPDHTSELLTQIIYGDAVSVLKVDGDWILVRLDDDYVGWIRSWHLTDITISKHESYMESSKHYIGVNHAEVFEAPDPDSLRITDLVVGTRLRASACGKRGWREVALADGRRGFITARSLRRIRARPRARQRLSKDWLATTGLRFLGTPYIWGGTTPKGFDCSGLIQRIYRLSDVLIPRDADLQAEFGRLLDCGDPRALETGDLLFFGKRRDQITHVAMILSDGLFLHAYGQVKVGSLDPRHPLYEKKLHGIWQLTRKPIG